MKAPFIDYDSDEPMRAVCRGLLARTLPVRQWTHQAHLVSTITLMREHPEIDLDLSMPGIIWRYNEASNGPNANTDTGGYHETITRFYLRALRVFLGRMPQDLPLHRLNAALIRSRFAAHDLPLDYYTREHLFSVEARRVWVEPDRAPFDFEQLLSREHA